MPGVCLCRAAPGAVEGHAGADREVSGADRACGQVAGVQDDRVGGLAGQVRTVCFTALAWE
jgi:hypothetical protein